MKKFVLVFGLLLMMAWIVQPHHTMGTETRRFNPEAAAATRPSQDHLNLFPQTEIGQPDSIDWMNPSRSNTQPAWLSVLNAFSLNNFSGLYNGAPASRPDTMNATAAVPTMNHVKQIRGHEGFWRLVQDQLGVWWFCSPADKMEFLNLVQTVQPYQAAREKTDPHYVAHDWTGGDSITGGNLAQWWQNTLGRISDVGFKGIGAWSNPAFHQLDVPMSQDLCLWEWMGQGSKLLYSTGWQTMADQICQKFVAPLRENKSLIGFYIDNELDWGDGFAGPGTYFDHLPAADPNRAQVIAVIKSIWPKVEDFNAAWDTKLTDLNQLTDLAALPRQNAAAYTKLSHEWLGHLATDYFRISTGLIHHYDPNHLILGVRFCGYAPEEVVRASRDYTDAQSLNYYVGDAMLDQAMFEMMYRESGQPIIISEYSFHSLDGRSGNRDTVGFQAQVPDQQARADGYRLMTTRLSRVPYVIGADWFQWFDESPAGRQIDGEDVNFGIVDIDDRPYEALTAAVKQTTPTLNPMHARSATEGDADLWRESYKTKPIMHVPFLATPPVLNGNLDHWPSESHLEGIRRENTVGLERAKVAAPDVYMGWTKQGLYLGFQVFDRHIISAPAKGSWWARDHIEFWISTHPVEAEQATYNVNCHQFFFVPTDYANNDGVAGVVGQWHRPGDAIGDHKIPDGDIEPAVRILPDRYVVEMFIPAKALHGFDPAHEPSMAFNVHVCDFEQAADFVWSAPKYMQTQLRPNTWGTIYLDPPGGTAAQARGD